MVDKNVCRHCKLSPPLVEIPLVNGEPRGECRKCRLAKEQFTRLKKHAYSDFYSFLHNLNSYNFKHLAKLPQGAYKLIARRTKEQIGYIVLNSLDFYVKIGSESHLFKPDLFGVSTFLANQNILIDSEPVELLDELNQPLDLASVGRGMFREDVGELLLVYDSKLQERAYKRLKAELVEEKRMSRRQANKRSINPMPK